MSRDERYKLIWYPCGNHAQLFDLVDDPFEMNDLAGNPDHAEVLAGLKDELLGEMYGSDEKWIKDGKLTGEPAKTFYPGPNRGLSLTRGNQWPVPPINTKGDMVFFPEARPADDP